MTEHTNSQSLQTLKEHQDMLRHVFITAQERILIISPFISMSAIELDKISDLVSEAVARGVDVQIYVDSESNCYSDGSMKTQALDGVSELVVAGAQVGMSNGINSKTLARDNDLFTEGSFNWLSAVRSRSVECQLKEHTQVYSGENALGMIAQELAKIEEIGYGLATFTVNGGIEVTKTGKIFSLICILVLPNLIGSDLGQGKAGFVCMVLMLMVFVVFYWLRGNQSRNEAYVSQV